MTFPNAKQQQDAKQMIEEHDRGSYYTLRQRNSLAVSRGSYGSGFGLTNFMDPMQVGDLLCALDNARIPTAFDPKVTAELVDIDISAREVFAPKFLGRQAVVAHNKADEAYRGLLLDIMRDGVDQDDRTGVGSRAVIGRMVHHDISNGKLPVLSTKQVFTKWIKIELLWMLSGVTNIRYLKEHGVDIWDSWVKKGTEVYEDLPVRDRYKLAMRIGGFDLPGISDLEGAWAEMNDLMDSKGVPNQVLVDGELPRIYQHQWRGWEDTRVVPSGEVEQYEARGYENLGPLDANYLNRGYGGSSVVHRKIDQLAKVIDQLRNKPDDRGIIVSAWNVAEVDEMALRPCHTLFQFFAVNMSVRERLEWVALNKPAGFEHLSVGLLRLINDHDDRRHEHEFKNNPELQKLFESAQVPTRKLSCLLYMRSNDVPLGHPFNIVQYAMLTHMVAQCVGMATDQLVWAGGNVHVYSDQWDGVIEHVNRESKPDSHPTIRLTPGITDLFAFKDTDIEIVGYTSQPGIKYPKAAV